MTYIVSGGALNYSLTHSYITKFIKRQNATILLTS